MNVTYGWAMSMLNAFKDFLEGMSAERIDEIDALYAEELDFADPMNQATDREHFKRIERDLFKQLKDIRFSVTSMQGDEREGYVSWVMDYRFRFWQRQITGVSHLKFNGDRRIVYQHDYWDASFSVYGEFPMIGLMMKGIKALLAVK